MTTLYIVTGTGRGLGAAIAGKILELGTHNVLLSISRSAVVFDATPDARVESLLVDLSDAEGLIEGLNGVRDFIRGFDRIVFISNAGVVTPIGAVGELEIIAFRAAAEVNAVAPAVICDFLMRHFSAKRLDFVNISSGAALHPIEGWAAYCAGKAFAKMFFDVLDRQTAAYNNITVHSIDPGVIDTDMQQNIREADASAFPQKDSFVRLKTNGNLQSAQAVAERILEQVNRELA